MRRLILLLLSFLVVSTFIPQTTFAASTTISLSPQSGSFAKPFTVNLVVDGHGDKFNAAEANVIISANIAIQNLVLGDCNFSFITTPDIQNPSFAGVILSGSSTKCTAYTLTLVPIAKGNGSITVSKESVKRYGDAVEVFSAANNGSYTLTAAFKAPSINPTGAISQSGLYTLLLKVYSSHDTPAPNMKVLLSSVPKKNNQQIITNTSGEVHFSNLPTGVYDATVMKDTVKVGETIINVQGPQHFINFGIDLSAQQNNPLFKSQQSSLLNNLSSNPVLLIGILVVGVIIGVGIAFFIFKLLGRKKMQ